MSAPVEFDGHVESTKRVTSTCLITFERNRYSVHSTYANRPVSLSVYPEKLSVITNGKVIAEHVSIFDRDHKGPGQTIYNWRHYLAVVQRKPGALRNGAPFDKLLANFKTLQKILLKRIGGDR